MRAPAAQSLEGYMWGTPCPPSPRSHFGICAVKMIFVLLYAIVHVLLLWTPRTCAQRTKAVCLEEFDWMTNSKGQSPCLVTSWLWVPCYGPNGSDLPPADDNDTIYEGPQDTDPFDSTPCDCNTVLYSTFAACAVCQGADIDPWPIYKTNCSDVFIGSYPESIPDGTAIPAWAFLNITRNSIFNVTAAKASAASNLPDITANSSLSTTTSSSPTTLLSTTTSASLTNSPHTSAFPTSSTTDIAPSSVSGGAASEGANSHGSNVTSIVGGTVSGVLGLLAIGAVVFYMLLRYRKEQQSRACGISAIGSAEHSTNMSDASGSVGRIYNANDPRTFPPPFVSHPASSVSSFPAVPRAATRSGSEPPISFYRGFPQV